MKKKLKQYFEIAVTALSAIGIGVIVWWFFGSLYTLEHPTKHVHFSHGPQDPVDTQ